MPFGNHFAPNWNFVGITVQPEPLIGATTQQRAPERISFVFERESMEFGLAANILEQQETDFEVKADIINFEKTLPDIVQVNLESEYEMDLNINVATEEIETTKLEVRTEREFIESLNFEVSPAFIPSSVDDEIKREQIVARKEEILKQIINNEIKGATARGKARLIATTTNKKLLTVEEEIREHLQELGEEFIDSDIPVIELMSVEGTELLQFLIAMGTRAYLAGFDYVIHVTGEEPEITLNDEIKIKQNAQVFFNAFWDTVRRGREEKFREENDLPNTPKQAIKGATAFDFFKQIAMMISTTFVNQGTIASNEIAFNQKFFDIDPLTDKEPTYEFVTMRDDKVDCKICAPLDGFLMKPSDIDYAVPPLHIGCRCRLLLHEPGNTLSG